MAGEARASRKRSLETPICVYDLAHDLGLVVEFKRYSTKGYEGLFIPAVKTIHLEPERPPGRQRFTCAHEIGHFVMRHGHVVACTTEATPLLNTSQEELLANVFASFLLMPKIAVMTAFRALGKAPEDASAADYYTIAAQFGVGYTNLLWHCFRNLEVLSDGRHGELEKKDLPRVRSGILEGLLPADVLNRGLHVVSSDQLHRPLDLAVGERVVFRVPVAEASIPPVLAAEPAGSSCFIAVKPGKGTVTFASGVQAQLRVYDGKGEGLWRALWDIEEGD
ncbi:MAG: ImmA/IrrE family metallo-endopeptidase [Myxococcota bacterium]